MDDKVRAFLQSAHAAAMVTLRRDGTPVVARVGVALVDGQLWSSGTQTRLRTRHLRRDPRCTLYVTGQGPGYLSLETTVTILEGPDVPDLSIRLFEVMQPNHKPGVLTWYGQDRPYEDFRRLMVEDQRLIYQFDIKRAYGMY